MRFAADLGPAHGPLLARERHPEWRQLLILAALRRADALRKLRDLPDTPTRAAPVVHDKVIEPAENDRAPAAASPDSEIAGVQPDAADGGVTGSVPSPKTDIPVDIGESSSAELPVVPQKQMPPVITMPALQPADATVPTLEPAVHSVKTGAIEQALERSSAKSSKQAGPAERARRSIAPGLATAKAESLTLPIPPVDVISIVRKPSEPNKSILVTTPPALELKLQDSKAASAPAALQQADGEEHAKPPKPDAGLKPHVVKTVAAPPKRKKLPPRPSHRLRSPKPKASRKAQASSARPGRRM
ncbi:MAG: hypothetical protein P8Y71_10355 [Pseudolabrys sp.]